MSRKIFINASLYYRDKEKYGWVESEPSEYQENVNYFNSFGALRWYKGWFIYDYNKNKNIYHRSDGPARIWQDGVKEYWFNGDIFPEIKTDEEWIIKQILE